MSDESSTLRVREDVLAAKAAAKAARDAVWEAAMARQAAPAQPPGGRVTASPAPVEPAPEEPAPPAFIVDELTPAPAPRARARKR